MFFKLFKEHKKQRKKSNREKVFTFTKILTMVIIGVSLVDIQLSYVLAALGRDQIAETLSVQMVVTILGTAITYMLRGFFDTWSEHKEKLKRDIMKLDDSINDIESEAGINDEEKTE